MPCVLSRNGAKCAETLPRQSRGPVPTHQRLYNSVPSDWSHPYAADPPVSTAAELSDEDVVLSEAVQRRCREAVTDLGSGVRVARLMFDATVRRMRLRDGNAARSV